MFIATCTERELRKRKKRKFSLWVRQCSSTGFIIQVSPGPAPEGREDLVTSGLAYLPCSLRITGCCS